MKKTTLIATFGSACLAISACAEADNTEDAAAPVDTGAAGADYDSSSGTVATPAPEPAANDTDTGDDGSRLRVGPDGAELEVDGDRTDVRVDSDGPSLEVDTDN